MLFGKNINRYYVRYMHLLLCGVLALFAVDLFQLEIPEFYRMLIDGVNTGAVVKDGVTYAFGK